MNIRIQAEKRAANASMIRGGNRSSSSKSNCSTRKSRTTCESGTAIHGEAGMLDEVDRKRRFRCRCSQLMKKANPERSLQSMPTMTRSPTS